MSTAEQSIIHEGDWKIVWQRKNIFAYPSNVTVHRNTEVKSQSIRSFCLYQFGSGTVKSDTSELSLRTYFRENSYLFKMQESQLVGGILVSRDVGVLV